MKRQIARVAIDLILAFCGALLTYEFFIILTQGIIYPIPNFSVFVIGAIAIFGIMGLGWWGIAIARFIREALVSSLLFGAGGTFLYSHVILPAFFVLMRGYPVNSYYGHELNTAILLGELIIFGILGLVGLGNVPVDVYKLWKLRRSILYL